MAPVLPIEEKGIRMALRRIRVIVGAVALTTAAVLGGCGLGNGSVTVILECGGDESVSVHNPSNRRIAVKTVTSSHRAKGNPEVVIGLAGRENGMGSVSLPEGIFRDAPDESARVEMVISGKDVVLEPSCSRPATYDP